MVVQAHSQSKLAHLLMPLVKDDEVAIDSAVLGDQLQEWDFDSAEDDMFMFFHEFIFILISWNWSVWLVTFDLRTFQERLSQMAIVAWIFRVLDVMADFEYSLFVFEVIEHSTVHLHVEIKSFVENWTERIINQTRSFAAAESDFQVFILVENRWENSNIQTIS